MDINGVGINNLQPVHHDTISISTDATSVQTVTGIDSGVHIATDFKLQFSRTCRLCLTQSTDCILLYSDNIATLVTYLPVYVTTSDHSLLSPWVCDSCVNKMRMVMEFFKMIFDSYKSVIANEVDGYCKKYVSKLTDDNKPSVAELCETKLSDTNKNILPSQNISESISDGDDEGLFKDDDPDPPGKKRFGGKIPQEVKESGKLLKLRYRVRAWAHVPIISLASLCTCSECGEQFNDHSSCQEHWSRVHKDKEFTYKCIEEEESCKFTTTKLRSMKDHIRQHMVELGFMKPCKICSKLFHKRHMRHHLKTHDTSRDFECNICGKKYKNDGALKGHMKTHLPQEEQYTFSCDICGKKYTSKAALKAHVKVTHLNEKEFECDLCDKKFLSACQLRYHQTSHTNEKPFMCDKCDASFKSKERLKIHIRGKHEGVFKFHCTICPAKYNIKSEFEAHFRSHTGEKPFNCSICGKGFSKSEVMRKHEKIHLPEEEKYIYPCEFCGKRFSVKFNLQTHIKGVHKQL